MALPEESGERRLEQAIGSRYSLRVSAKKSTSTTRAAKARDEFVEYLANKDDILFLTTSNRYVKHKDDVPKSTQLARSVKAHFAKKNIRILDVPLLKIYTCEGNISARLGNRCGLKEAALENKRFNPTGYHLFRVRPLGPSQQHLSKTL
jgi:hypothetical protein